MSGLNFAIKSDYFEDTVFDLVKAQKIGSVIETGTYKGAGSTVIFAKTGLPVTTIESCKNHYDEALRNLRPYTNVTCLHGSTLDRDEMLNFIQMDNIYNSDLVARRDIAVDGGETELQCKNFYQSEVLGFGTEIPQYNLLADVFRNHVSSNNQKILVFLDSAGGVGYLEFLKLMGYVEELKCADRIVLILDDVTHVKHYRSVIWLNQNGYKPNISMDGRFAHCVLSDR